MTHNMRRQRLLIWQMMLALFKNAHTANFKGRRFGEDLPMLFVFGACVGTELEGQPVRATKVAEYLGMPRETVRRHLRTLVQMELLTTTNHTYATTGKVTAGHVAKAVALVQQTAKQL